LAKGSFGPKLREQIALAVGQANQCAYCVSAHTLLGAKAGLSETEAMAARSGEAGDARSAAVLRLALAINGKQGRPTDADLAAARAAGLGDAEIAETVANVALNVFTNYFNHVADTQIDFPVVKL
jgi:AhpD family alkylhydroperoxidase